MTRRTSATRFPRQLTLVRPGFHPRSLGRRAAAAAAIAIVAVTTAGCVAFAGRQLPEQGMQGLKPQDIGVAYDAEWFSMGVQNANVTAAFSVAVRDNLQESGMFSPITQGNPRAPLYLDFTMKNEGSPGLAVLAGIISGLTLTIIPVSATDNYILSVEVSREGRAMKTYTYEDHISTWIQLFLVFAMAGRTPQQVAENTYDNMVRTFLHDLQRDLGSGALGAVASP